MDVGLPLDCVAFLSWYAHTVPLRKAGIMDGSVAEHIPSMDVPRGGTSYNHSANIQNLEIFYGTSYYSIE